MIYTLDEWMVLEPVYDDIEEEDKRLYLHMVIRDRNKNYEEITLEIGESELKALSDIVNKQLKPSFKGEKVSREDYIPKPPKFEGSKAYM